MKNMPCPHRELIRLLTDLLEQLREYKIFQQECTKIKSLIRQLQIHEQLSRSDLNQGLPKKPSVSGNNDKYIARIEFLTRLVILAKEVWQVVKLLLGS